VCRMRLRVVLHNFGVCLNGLLGGQIKWQRNCDRVSSYRSGVSGMF
jgi:hypothetical protein